MYACFSHVDTLQQLVDTLFSAALSLDNKMYAVGRHTAACIDN